MDEDEATLRELVARLNSLKMSVGDPTLATLKERAELLGLDLPPQTVSAMLRGERTPRWRTVHAFVETCRAHARAKHITVSKELLEAGDWRRRWEDTTQDAEARASKAPAMSRVEQEAPERAPSAGPRTWIFDNQNVQTGDHSVAHITVTYGRPDEDARARTGQLHDEENTSGGGE